MSLKRLDLSYNKIRKLENLAELVSLEYFDVRANAISSVNDIDELRVVKTHPFYKHLNDSFYFCLDL